MKEIVKLRHAALHRCSVLQCFETVDTGRTLQRTDCCKIVAENSAQSRKWLNKREIPSEPIVSCTLYPCRMGDAGKFNGLQHSVAPFHLQAHFLWRLISDEIQ